MPEHLTTFLPLLASRAQQFTISIAHSRYLPVLTSSHTTIHRPSFLPSTRPKLKLHLLVIQHHSCPSSLVLRRTTLSSRIQVPRLLSTPHLILSIRSCSCNIVYLEPVEVYYLHMQKERNSRLHSQVPLPSHYWPIPQLYS